MPYGVQKRGNKFVTINTETGDVKGTHASRAEAESQRRLLEGVKHGWKPTHGDIQKTLKKKVEEA